ncbi:hypothetical protein JOD18_004190 [Gracilibacillus alcaliphilus]|nr:hypothetical protein [Gracilibacillus alcaliphilus]
MEKIIGLGVKNVLHYIMNIDQAITYINDRLAKEVHPK